jgi:hypothetical protein
VKPREPGQYNFGVKMILGAIYFGSITGREDCHFLGHGLVAQTVQRTRQLFGGERQTLTHTNCGSSVIDPECEEAHGVPFS